MRSIILAGALMAMAPLALAQPYTPGSATPPPPAGTTYSPNGSAPPVSAGDQGMPQSGMPSQHVNQSQADPNKGPQSLHRLESPQNAALLHIRSHSANPPLAR